MTVAAFAPGRVNLIGDHTDYNGGLALPFAITQGVTVRAQPLEGERVRALALDLGDGERDQFHVSDPGAASGWRAFVRGAVAELTAAGRRPAGASLEITGSLPRGGGLASSAALSVALCLALLAVSDSEPPDRRELASICSRIENRWVGANTGLLDQLAALFGQAGHALLIDFETLELTPVELRLKGHRLVLLDSGGRHRHATDAGGYNQRRLECQQACERLGIPSLRHATAAMVSELPEPLAGRARHVLSENQRVLDTVAALDRGDLAAVGRLLDESHKSLRDDYAVGAPALDRAVARLHAAGALGARQIGGGFGGHALGLLAPDLPLPPGAFEVSPGAAAQLLQTRSKGRQ